MILEDSIEDKFTFNWQNLEKIYFIGLCGIGMSALAQLIKRVKPSVEVRGSDIASNYIAENLIKQGIKVIIGHNGENITSDLQIVVYSSAISSNNVELQEAKRRGIRTMTRGQLLAEMTRGAYNIGVAGSHGKTTTTALLGAMLHANWKNIFESSQSLVANRQDFTRGSDYRDKKSAADNGSELNFDVPSMGMDQKNSPGKDELIELKEVESDLWIINGGIIQDFGSNIAILQGLAASRVRGEMRQRGIKDVNMAQAAMSLEDGEFGEAQSKVESNIVAVMETDESDGTFSLLQLKIAIITNIDREHMDFYGSFENLLHYYQEFSNKTLKNDGIILVCADDAGVNQLMVASLAEHTCNNSEWHSQNIYTYGCNAENDWQILDFGARSEGMVFSLSISERAQRRISQDILRQLLNLEEKFVNYNISVGISENKSIIVRNIRVKQMGKHNIYNATAALMGSIYGASIAKFPLNLSTILSSMNNFAGVKRRMQKLGFFGGFEQKAKNIVVFDDYAHHPREIEAVLDSLPFFLPWLEDKKEKVVNKEQLDNGRDLNNCEEGGGLQEQPKVVLVLEPHRYSRWRDLMADFESVLLNNGHIDALIITEIYGAAESETFGISADSIIEKLRVNLEKRRKYNGRLESEVILKASDCAALKIILSGLLEDNSVILCLGAGNISKWAQEIAHIST